MVLPILRWPNSKLSKKCSPVSLDDPDLQRLISDLKETMAAAQGIGLAANQVGVLKRVLVLNVGRGPEVFLNPRLVKGMGPRQPMNEGCLSLPGLYESIPRYQEVFVEGIDPKSGATFCESYTGLRAHVLQHEIEHLDGKFFLDHVSPGRRDQIRAAFRKARR